MGHERRDEAVDGVRAAAGRPNARAAATTPHMRLRAQRLQAIQLLPRPRGAQASDQDVVHMVDFGCCTPIEQQPQTPTRPPLVDGTPLFASRAAHLGEALDPTRGRPRIPCFCLAYLSGTTLP